MTTTRHKLGRLFGALVLAASVTMAAHAFNGRFQDCAAGEQQCGPGCTIWALGCNYCQVIGCGIEYDECQDILCDDACADPCIIIP